MKPTGLSLADAFHCLSKEEQRAIILRALAGSVRSNARRAGHPEPVILEAKVKPLPGGGYVLDQDSLKPLRAEYGGDGRTPADALAEARAMDSQLDPKGAKAAADRIKAQLKARTG